MKSRKLGLSRFNPCSFNLPIPDKLNAHLERLEADQRMLVMIL